MPLDSTTTGIGVARPTILIDGKEDSSLVGGLKYLLIIEKTDGFFRCEAKFGNWGPTENTTDFLYFDRKVLDFGKEVQIKIGQEEIFKGKISALEAEFPEAQSPEITFLAEDALQNLRMTRRTRTFENVSDADIFRKIASEHSLNGSIDVQSPTHKVLAQINQSDLAFLRERARAIDAEIWLKDKELSVKSRSKRGQDKLQLKQGAQLREFCVKADLANQLTSVTASGWDVASKKEIKYETKDSLISSELGNDESGIGILKKAFGERKETIVHSAPINSQDAQYLAESFMKTLARQFVVGRGVAEPNAKLRVGAFVELDGLGKMFNGKYYVAEIAHIFDNAKGFRTEFKAERLGIGK
ncbi:MAG TPA: contractile injection system protein, VgrG/Pvc8 family [Pyrinomonadaceae bacterium]|nr:contractile injection system protein, VgrG/Pvc8 family [Pyrinomonadaceae bacterium]